MRSRNLPSMKQLSLFDTKVYEKARSHYDIEDGDDDWPPPPVKETNWPPDAVSEVVIESLNIVVEVVIESKSLNPEIDSITTNPCGAIGKYHARGNTRGNPKYWRFSYRDGRRVRHVHIPGGNCTNPVAVARADLVRHAIANGRSAPEILELIRPWTRKNQ
jgi:hypothetical protein